MSTPINDFFTPMRSAVRFEPTSNIRFLAEELRRYGIKTNQKNDKGKVVFFQSAHIIMIYDMIEAESITPRYALVSFKDLFNLIGKNDSGVDDQDIVRVWEIAHKLEKRSIIEIKGTSGTLLEKEEEPTDIPDTYANLCHIYRNDDKSEDITFKSKFATNKSYKTNSGKTLLGVSDFFVII
jgi:hypothetical protein